MNMASGAPTITFDASGKVRVLEADKFDATAELEKEARAFATKVGEFSGTVHDIVESLTEQSARIELAKLKAIGQRNLVDNEREARKAKGAELQALIDEKVAELARLTAEFDSLSRVETQQRDLIEKLSNNESGGV